MLYYIGRFIFFVLFKSLFGFKFYGKENIPKYGGFIIASNHASNLDPEIIGSAIPRVLSFMAKEELFHNKVFGWVLWKVHAFPVKRGGADLFSIKEAIKRLKNGFGILLFPQGGRRDSISADEVKGGVGFLASKADVPVIPAFIFGSGDALPKGRKIPNFFKPISVYFAPGIIYKGSRDYAEFSQTIMSAIDALSRKAK
ncbi:MAG: lysophospholipid acyltransferase family protein [Candidatus Omnitrophota bacterium]|nr:lysophospholipid acyltransferase family protein [Candidatus Omnitrophota bacterium]